MNNPIKKKLTIEDKIKNLKELKAKLETELEDLSKKRLEKVLEVLNHLPDSVSLETITGGIVHVLKEIQSNPKQAEDWSRAGKKFLESKRTERASILRKKD
jgi:hypothetical protein